MNYSTNEIKLIKADIKGCLEELNQLLDDCENQKAKMASVAKHLAELLRMIAKIK